MTKSVMWGLQTTGMPGIMPTLASHAGKAPSIGMISQTWPSTFASIQSTLDTIRTTYHAVPALEWYSSQFAIPSEALCLKGIIAGTQDTYLHTWAAACAAWGHPFFMIFDNEMNGSWMAGYSDYRTDAGGPTYGFNAKGDFAKMWKHVVDIFRAEGATNATWVLTYNNQAGDNSGFATSEGTQPVSQFYVPGYVDWIGLHFFAYNGSPQIGGLNQATSIGQLVRGAGGYAGLGDVFGHLIAMAPNLPQYWCSFGFSSHRGVDVNPNWRYAPVMDGTRKGALFTDLLGANTLKNATYLTPIVAAITNYNLDNSSIIPPYLPQGYSPNEGDSAIESPDAAAFAEVTGGANVTGTTTTATSTTLTDTSKTWTTNAYQNQYVKITGGLGSGQIRQITSHTNNTLTVAAWGTVPNNTSTYRIGLNYTVVGAGAQLTAWQNGIADALYVVGDVTMKVPADHTPIQVYGTDPPGLTVSPPVGVDLTATTATIRWTSLWAGNSWLQYGNAGGAAGVYPNSTAVTNTSPMVVSHAVTITGLTANSTYHYRARTEDAWANAAASPDYTFTTPSASGDSYLAAEAAIAGRVAHWRLGDVSKAAAATMADVLAAFNGTYGGTVADATSIIPSTPNHAASFQGAGWGQVPTAAGLSVWAGASAKGALSVWFTETAAPSATQALAGKGGSTTNSWEAYFERTSTGLLANVWDAVGSAYLTTQATVAVSANTRHRATMVWDYTQVTVANRIRVYFDGVDTTFGSVSGAGVTPTAGTSIFTIGERGAADHRLGSAGNPVVVQEVVLRNAVLTATQELSLYNAGNAPVTRTLDGSQPNATGVLARVARRFRDLSGNQTFPEGALDTNFASKITNVSAIAAGSSITVTWTTNSPYPSAVEYGPTPNLGYYVNQDSEVPVASHRVTISNLTPNTLYYYRAEAPIGNGSFSASAVQTIRTLAVPFTLCDVGRGSDRTSYVTPDGVEYVLAAPAFLLQEDGLGMPPIEYVTDRGPSQHGESVKNFFLRPRTIQVIMRRQGNSRSEYWNMRNALLDSVRPGRTGVPPAPGLYRKYLANGSVREFLVFTSEGPSFPSHDPSSWDQWSIQDTIRFTCYDPPARDPTLHSRAYASSGAVAAFPITFPYTFAAFGSGNQDVQYDGTWLTYPTIRLNGPLTGPFVRNLTTGEKIILNYTLASGRSIAVDLAYGKKTVTLDDGTSLIGMVSSDSDLASFHLQPGLNRMQITATGTSTISGIALEWYNRYIGI